MTTKVCTEETTEDMECGISETDGKSDVFEVFLPNLWVLRVAGVWLPGDLKTAPSVKESLRGGFKAVLYFLYCVVVLVSVGVQCFRFIPYAVEQTGAEFIMVLIVFIPFFTPVYMFSIVLYFRKSLVDFVEELNVYYGRYGQRSYMKDIMKIGRRSLITNLILVVLVVSAQALYCYEWATALHWMTTPVDRESPWYILVPWKAYLAVGWIIVGISEVSYMNFVGITCLILRHEFSDFNKAVQALMSNIDKCCNRRTLITDCTEAQRQMCGFVRQIRVAQAPQDRGCVEESSHTEGETKGVDEINNELDDLRSRFDNVVDVVEKGNKAVQFQLVDVLLVCIPFMCLVIKGLTEVHNKTDYIVFMSLCLVALTSSVLYYSVEAVRLNMEAHASSQHLLRASVRNLSEKTIQIINLFLYRLNGSPVGFSLLGLITIDLSFVLTMTGTLIGYIFVVLQFNIQMSCPAASASEVTTVLPANTTVMPA